MTVVTDQMDVEALGGLTVDLVEELPELDRPVPAVLSAVNRLVVGVAGVVMGAR